MHVGLANAVLRSAQALDALLLDADFGMQSARDMAGSETDVNPLEAMYLNRYACATESIRPHVSSSRLHSC